MLRIFCTLIVSVMIGNLLIAQNKVEKLLNNHKHEQAFKAYKKNPGEYYTSQLKEICYGLVTDKKYELAAQAAEFENNYDYYYSIAKGAFENKDYSVGIKYEILNNVCDKSMKCYDKMNVKGFKDSLYKASFINGIYGNEEKLLLQYWSLSESSDTCYYKKLYSKSGFSETEVQQRVRSIFESAYKSAESYNSSYVINSYYLFELCQCNNESEAYYRTVTKGFMQFVKQNKLGDDKNKEYKSKAIERMASEKKLQKLYHFILFTESSPYASLIRYIPTDSLISWEAKMYTNWFHISEEALNHKNYKLYYTASKAKQISDSSIFEAYAGEGSDEFFKKVVQSGFDTIDAIKIVYKRYLKVGNKSFIQAEGSYRNAIIYKRAAFETLKQGASSGAPGITKMVYDKHESEASFYSLQYYRNIDDANTYYTIALDFTAKHQVQLSNEEYKVILSELELKANEISLDRKIFAWNIANFLFDKKQFVEK